MAASKRFLGLGFTFAATDKGLEAKLKKVSEHLATISDQLGDMDAISNKAAVGMQKLADIKIKPIDKNINKNISVGSKKVSDMDTSKVKNKIVKKNKTVENAKIEKEVKKTTPKAYPKMKKEVVEPLPKEFQGTKRHTVMPTGQAVKMPTPPGSDDDVGEVINLFDRTSQKISKTMDNVASGLKEAAAKKTVPKESKVKTLTLGKAFETKALNKDMHAIFADVGKFVQKEVGDKGFAQWANIMNDVFVQIDETGKINADSLKKAKRITDGFVGGVKDVEKKMTSIKVVFGSIKAYFNDVFHAADNFLDSIGIRIRDMIPPQIKAAFNLAKTIISPVLSLPKMLMRTSEKKMQKTVMKNTEHIWKVSEQGNEFLKIMSDEISGKSTNTDGINENIKKAFGKDDKDKKGGLFGSLFDSLKGMLLGIPFLGPIIGKIGSIVSSVFKGIAKVGQMLWKSLKWLGEAIWGTLKFVWRFKNVIGETILPIIAIGTALAGFAKGVWDSRQKWSDAISNFTDMISRAFTGEFWVTLFGNVKEIFTAGSWEVIKEFGRGMWGSFKEIIQSIIDKIKNFDVLGLLKMPFEGLFNSYKNLGSTIPDVMNLAIDKLTKKTPEVKTEEFYRSQIAKNPNKPLSVNMNDSVKASSDTKNLKDSLVAINNTASASNAELLKATIQTNELLRQQLFMIKSQQNKPVTVKLEAKTSEGTVLNALKKQQVNAMSGAGMGL